MNFVDNWKRGWKFISIQCFAVIAAGHGAAGIAAIAGVTNDFYARYGHEISTATIVLAFIGGFGVLTQQDSLPDWLPMWKLKQPEDK